MGRTTYLRSASLCLLLATILSGCSGDQEKKEPGTIEKMTDKAAEEAIQSIRQPIERAERSRLFRMRTSEQSMKR